MAYNPDIHHRRSIRLQNYDYSQQGAYFVTICTLQRECLFGEIIEREIQLNDYGKIVLKWWNKLNQHFPKVETDAFVIMPNHIHGIVVIEKSKGRTEVTETENVRNAHLGQIIAYFKYQSTKQINGIRGLPGVRIWQRNYYEHIIRNEDVLNRAREYIIDNPASWDKDRENPERIK
jgi:REP element-mobilizing transposase RayT